jgi:hypothetical protein
VYPDPAAAAVRFLRATGRSVVLGGGPLTGRRCRRIRRRCLKRRGEPLYARLFWLALGGKICQLECLGNAAAFERFGRRSSTRRAAKPLSAENAAVACAAWWSRRSR